MSRVTDYDSISSEYDRRYRGQEYPGIEHALSVFLGSSSAVAVLEVGALAQRPCRTVWFPLAQAMAADQAQGTELVLLADLRLYATVGWRDE